MIGMRASILPNGAKVVDCTMFRGVLFAASEEGVYYLDAGEWRRLEVVPKRNSRAAYMREYRKRSK